MSVFSSLSLPVTSGGVSFSESLFEPFSETLFVLFCGNLVREWKHLFVVSQRQGTHNLQRCIRLSLHRWFAEDALLVSTNKK